MILIPRPTGILAPIVMRLTDADDSQLGTVTATLLADQMIEFEVPAGTAMTRLSTADGFLSWDLPGVLKDYHDVPIRISVDMLEVDAGSGADLVVGLGLGYRTTPTAPNYGSDPIGWHAAQFGKAGDTNSTVLSQARGVANAIAGGATLVNCDGLDFMLRHWSTQNQRESFQVSAESANGHVASLRSDTAILADDVQPYMFLAFGRSGTAAAPIKVKMRVRFLPHC